MIRSKKRHFVWLIAAEAVAITTYHRALCASWMLAQLRADVIDGWPPWRGSPRLKNPARRAPEDADATNPNPIQPFL
jgi:hypothetical protein